jgi:hypothetical protein
MITGPAAAWLAAHRSELNRRYEIAHRRQPSLQPEPFAALLERVLPAIAAGESDASGALDALYDLLLQLTARDALAVHPGLNVLLVETLPRLRPLLVARPTLARSLVNAVERLGERGAQLAHTIAACAGVVGSAEELLDAGAVAAWRLGEARLRAAACRVMPHLPGAVTLRALALDDWPHEGAPLAVAALARDAWWPPQRVVSERTLASLRGAPPERLAALVTRLGSGAGGSLARWQEAARVGEFSGFGGAFDAPPLVLDSSDRHRFHAISAGTVWQIDADCFGWRCTAAGKAADSGPTTPRRVGAARGGGADAVLLADGTLVIGSDRATLPVLAGASSLALLSCAVAASFVDSHRIRVLAPPPEPV